MFYTDHKGGDSMVYSESVVYNELRWEYGFPKWWVMQLIEKHKAQGTYEDLCRRIELRKSITREEC